jgi:hypothetical protein
MANGAMTSNNKGRKNVRGYGKQQHDRLYCTPTDKLFLTTGIPYMQQFYIE